MQIKSLRIKSYRSWAIADTASEAAIATRHDISLIPPSALYQCNAWQVSRDRSARVQVGLSAIKARMDASSSALKSRPL